MPGCSLLKALQLIIIRIWVRPPWLRALEYATRLIVPPPASLTLVNQVTYSPGVHRYNGTQYTIYGDGVHDDTASLQAAVNQGDVLVEPPSNFYYLAPLGNNTASI